MEIKFGRLIKLCGRFSNPLKMISVLREIFYFNFIDYSLQTCFISNKTFTTVSKYFKLNSLQSVILPFIFLYFTSSFGQVTQTFITNGNFTVPAGVTSITVEAWGAGGGGGSTTANNQAGSGGGGGAYARSVLSVTAGTNYSVVVGTGGAAATNGGNSTFNSNWVIAAGGQGGNTTTFIGGLGGSAANSIGTVKHAGGNGGNSLSTTYSGGGGGGAGSTGAGGNAMEIKGGLGTSSNGGNGGDGVNSNVNANNGNNYGGGGSGAYRVGGPNRNGGLGANGLVLISWIQGPTLIVNPTTINFGYVVNGGTSTVISYTLNGTNLTGAPGNIVINAPANFEVSLTAGSGFSSSVNVPYSGSTLASTTIYARFKPTASNTNYIGNITHTGGGATANVGVNGTSISSYCSSTGNMSFQTSITRVQFDAINNTTAKPTGYSDFTVQSANVNVGSSYNLSVNVNTDGNYTISTNAWIDWNQNGNFSDAGETYNLGTALNTPNGPTSLSPLNITIPAGATLGNTRMRVSTKHNAFPTSCETAFNGEVEDYTINVYPACTIPTITGTTPASRCGTGTVVLGATASAGIINWYAASTGGTSLGTGTSFTTPSITTTTTYWVDTTNNGCVSSPRTSVIATVNTIPTITGTTPASRCGTGTVVLGATASAGIINWYAASTGGTSLGTGISFTTPSITTTTTYWVDTTNNGCVSSPRTAVIATVNVVPVTPGLISGGTTLCESISGQIYSITAVPDASSYTWTVPTGWTITSGNGTTSITVTVGIAGQNGNITVTANSCSASSAQTLAVTVNSCINKWKGNISNDWNTPANWTLNIVPAVDATILFDNIPLNHLVLDQDRTVTDITNAQSTYRMVLNGKKLTLKGALIFSNGAQIDASANNSTIEFSGAVPQTIPSNALLNNAVFNLSISTPNHLRFVGNLRLLNSINTPSSGRLDAVTNNPTVIFSGNTSQNMVSNQFLGEQIHNLTIDNELGVNLNSNITIQNLLTINSGKIFTIASVNQLNVLGNIINNAGTSGLILKSNSNGTASLLHNTNNVAATVERYISRNAEDWHFLSSPVNNQPISGSWLPTGTYGNGTGYDLYVWNEPTFCWFFKNDTANWNLAHPTANFVTGRGYLYSVQANKPTKMFAGNLNNGLLNYPLTKSTTTDENLKELEGFNLVGNPYPSSVDWSATTGWLRTNLTPSAGGYDMWVWNPETNNYGVYNSFTQIGTNEITRYLAPMQGFFVRASNSGNFGMDNSVRTHTGAGNWFRTSNTNNGLIRITVQSEAGKGSDEALLQFGFSNNQWGASKIFSHITSAPSLYLETAKEDYSVQYLTNTTDNKLVPVAFKAGADGNYTLKLDFDTSAFDFVMLEDRITKTKQLIKAHELYQFKATIKDTDKRFVLHFNETGIDIEAENPAKIYTHKNYLMIDLSLVNYQSEVFVYNISGTLILKKSLKGTSFYQLPINTTTQVLIVKLVNEQGQLNKKLFIKGD